MMIMNVVNVILLVSFVMPFRAVAAWTLQSGLKAGAPSKLSRCFASVTGTAYTSDDPNAPIVRLFTKEGCTLCDKVKEVLQDIQQDHPHSLEQVDITDEEHKEWFSKYKYDIPVLHVDDKFWIKHRIDEAEARNGLVEAREGRFAQRPGEPNAEAMERS